MTDPRTHIDLREEIAQILADITGEYPIKAYLGEADRILAIPAIADALQYAKAWQDAHVLGTGFMKDGKRIDPADIYIKPPKPGPNEVYSHDVGKHNPSIKVRD